MLLMLPLLELALPLESIGAHGVLSGHFLRRASLYDGLQLRGSIAGRCCPLSPLIDQGTRETRSIPNKKKIIHIQDHTTSKFSLCKPNPVLSS